jgi:HAD superfamily hydrolase (TIGR01490 family)
LKKIAFFDFDGTITNKDTLFHFIRFYVGEIKFVWGMIVLMPMLIKFKVGLIRNDTAKEHLLSYFFRGESVQIFKEKARVYAHTKMTEIVRPKALEKINWHQSQGDDVIIVSASMECWLKPWCEMHSVSLISTRLEVLDGEITGKFSTKNCHGIEKENRIKELYNLENYSYIYAYGDSNGDKALLALANESYYKPFRGANTL